MTVITKIAIYPDQSARQDQEATSAIIQAGKHHRQRLVTEWSFLEAAAWIATRSPELVNGIAPYHLEVAPVARQLLPKEPAGTEYLVARLVADTVAQAFCQCDRKIDCRSSVAEWNELSKEEQAAAASDAQAKWRMLYIRAHTHICTCFDTAVRALFVAAATGKVSATAGALREPISRLEWQQADYDFLDGLRLGARRVDLVHFRPAAIRKLWSASICGGMLPKAKGRPGANLQPVRDAFQERRDQGIPLERSQLREWAACIAIAQSKDHADLPAPDTCRKRLGELYEAAHADKGG